MFLMLEQDIAEPVLMYRGIIAKVTILRHLVVQNQVALGLE